MAITDIFYGTIKDNGYTAVGAVPTTGTERQLNVLRIIVLVLAVRFIEKLLLWFGFYVS